MDEFANDVTAIKELADAAHGIREQNGVPFILAPPGYDVKSLTHMLPHPPRKKASVKLSTLDSFIDYANEQSQDSSRIFADVTDRGATFVAVLDFHEEGKGAANWGEHRVTFACEPTVEWKRWLDHNKKQMSQIQFAEFMEENQLAVRTPVGADLLELIQTLEGKKNVRFDSTQRLSNGRTVLNYEEDIVLSGNAGTNKGKIEFPTELKLGIAPFKGSDTYAVMARVRHRIEDRAMRFSYELVDPHLVIENVCKEMIEKIEKETELTIFHGTAP